MIDQISVPLGFFFCQRTHHTDLRSMVKMSPTSKKIIFHELLYRPCLCNRSVFLLQFSPKKQFIVMSIDWDIRCSEGVILADTWFQQIANIFPGSVLVLAGGGHGQNSSCRVKKTSRTTACSWVTGKGGTFLPDRVCNSDFFLPVDHLTFQHLLSVLDPPPNLFLRLYRVLKINFFWKILQKLNQIKKSLAVKMAFPGLPVHKPVQ